MMQNDVTSDVTRDVRGGLHDSFTENVTTISGELPEKAMGKGLNGD